MAESNGLVWTDSENSLNGKLIAKIMGILD